MMTEDLPVKIAYIAAQKLKQGLEVQFGQNISIVLEKMSKMRLKSYGKTILKATYDQVVMILFRNMWYTI